MKKSLFILFCFSFLLQCTTQTKNITQSTDIKEIETYLKNAHPDDQYRVFLKRKLVALKNSAWAKSGQGVPMAARPLVTDIPTSKNSKNFDKALFDKLLADASKEQSSQTLKLLNELFSENAPENPNAIIMIRNQSDCDLILKMEGKKSYNLAIPSNGETSIVVNKGEYNISTNMCDALYSSKKQINANLLLALKKS